MKYQRWKVADAAPADVERLMEEGYSYLLASVLAARGVSTAQQAADRLSRDRTLRLSPFLMRDMDRAVRRISQALEQGERIAVFGDYDVDGITATCLLTDYLRRRGADCLRYIPRRIEEGYGLGKEAIHALQQQGVSLIVTVDCGITGVEEALYAAQLGVDLVITDHHECKEQLPRAAAVVDPHRPDCPYPFKQLAGVGVALKLVLALGGAAEQEALLSRYCALAAIGTVADVMEMREENRTIVTRGLENLEESEFVGIRALLRECGLQGKPVSSIQVGFVLSPRLNAAGRMGQAELAADLLLTEDPARAEELAKALCQLNRERQAVEQSIFAQAVEQIEALPPESRHALVLASETWHQGVVGVVASRLSEKYACPCFMIHLADGVGKGSCRSYGGFNLFAALESCGDLLEGFGGHELAAGFTIREENIPAFRRRMNLCARQYCGGQPPVSSLEADAVLQRLELVTEQAVEDLSALEPYGCGNARPVFCLWGATLQTLQDVGQNQHLRLRLQKGTAQFEAIFFSTNSAACGLVPGQRVDAAFCLQINEFRGRRSLQLQLIDLRPSLFPSAREAEELALFRGFLSGAAVSPREAGQLLPGREQFVSLWRGLQRRDREGSLGGDKLPLLRELAGAAGGSNAFSRTLVCLAVWEERGLLKTEQTQERLQIRLCPQAGKVDLEACPYMQALRRGQCLREGGDEA